MMEDVFLLELELFWGGQILSHAHETGTWYLLGVIFKSSDEHLRPVYMGDPPTLAPGGLRMRESTYGNYYASLRLFSSLHLVHIFLVFM